MGETLGNPNIRLVRPEESDPFETMGGFEEGIGSETLYADWRERFGEQPLDFFTEQNLQRIKEMPAEDRLVLLAFTSKDITVTPDMAEKYFKTFPQDLEVVRLLFESCRGLADGYWQHQLFTLTAENLRKTIPNFDTYPFARGMEQYLEKAARRHLAPKFLLKGFKPSYGADFKEFGAAANGFLEALDEAAELSMKGDHFMDASQIFTKEFEALPETEKAKLLRQALAEVQYALVFDETFNSAFTAENVERWSRESKSSKFEYHNKAHSILFQTYQPLSIYGKHQVYFQHGMDSTAEIGGYLEEYPFHKLALAILDRLKDIREEKDQNTDVVVDFWDKNRDPIFSNGAVEVLSRQNSSRAAGSLLRLIRTEQGDKNALASILYRLEFGKIGISQDGVRYLERMYDLGEYNNPNYFVHRLTAQGDVGIFDDNRELIRYFNLGDLATEEQIIKAKVLDFTYETLFTSKANEAPEERQRRERILEEFQKKYFSFYNDRFFQETKVHFNNLSFREQGWYLHFMENSGEDRQQKGLSFVNKYGEEGFRTFLSLEYGEDLGDKILAIGEKLPMEAARAVFAKYCEIVNAAQEVRTALQKQVPGGDGRILENITEFLLKKAKGLLTEVADELENKPADQVVEPLLQRLRMAKADIILFAGLFKNLPSGQKTDLGEIAKVALESKDSADLTKQEQEEMKHIFESNRQKSYPEKLLAYTRRDFEQTVRSKGHVFRILKYNNQIVAFFHIDRLDQDNFYVGSLNLHPSAKDSPIAVSMVMSALEQMPNVNIKAVVWKDNPARLFYTRVLGFKKAGEIADYHGTGEAYWVLLRPKRSAVQEESLREVA